MASILPGIKHDDIIRKSIRPLDFLEKAKSTLVH